MDNLHSVYVAFSIVFHLMLCIHFAVRKWHFQTTIRWGWLVYALSLPALGLSVWLKNQGVEWFFWIAGILYFIWSLFGFGVEYIFRIEWRNSWDWPILIPYVGMYLAVCMFTWWPVARVSKTAWFAITVLFIIGTILNISSHHPNKQDTITSQT